MSLSKSHRRAAAGAAERPSLTLIAALVVAAGVAGSAFGMRGALMQLRAAANELTDIAMTRNSRPAARPEPHGAVGRRVVELADIEGAAAAAPGSPGSGRDQRADSRPPPDDAGFEESDDFDPTAPNEELAAILDSDPELRTAITELLNDPDPEIRREALVYLGELSAETGGPTR